MNLNPLGPVDGEENVLADKNITSLALEVPISCLTNGNDPVIGAWTTASSATSRFKWSPDSEMSFLNAGHGKLTQVSRLGMPLVNELVIGIGDKDDFNASEPKDDGQFATYVTNPTLPVLIQVLFGVPAPATPRNDLVQVFLTGVPGVNQPQNVKPAEMLRLNTSIAPALPAAQSPVGVLGGDMAGFPNGRRPGDDVVDIALRAVEGILLPGHPAGDRRAERRRAGHGDHRLHADGAMTRRPGVCAVPPRVPLPANTTVRVGRADAPVVGEDCAMVGW